MSGEDHDWVRNAPSDPERARAELARLRELDELKRLVRAHPAEAFALAMEEFARGHVVLRAVAPGRPG